MYRICKILIFLLPITGLGQVHFPKVIHDFGLVPESKGTVEHRFAFTNLCDHPVRVIHVQPTCGCTVSQMESVTVPAQTESWVDVVYDPKDRPGYFLKSVEIAFESSGDTLVRHIAVKGFTVEERDHVVDEEQAVNYDIRLVPFKAGIRYADRWRLQDKPQFSDFINDLTFVIDQYNFVEVKMTLFLSDTTNTKAFKAERAASKSLIAKELERRGYPGFSVGFLPDSIAQLDGDGRMLGAVELTVPAFLDRSIPESLVRDLNAAPPSSVGDRPPGVTDEMIHYVELKRNGKPTDKSAYERFLKYAQRNALSRHEIWLGTVVPDHKTAKRKYSKRAAKALKKLGVDKKIIYTREPIVSEQLPEERLLLSEFIPPVPDSIKSSNQQDTGMLYDLSAFKPQQAHLYREVDGQVIQDLPAYFQQIKGHIKRVDTTNQFFISMMDVVIDEVKNGKRIEMVMESSASKAPAYIKVDNFYVARLRANESQDIIRTYLKARGLKDEDIVFRETVPIISGPEYDPQYYLPQYYYYFQYLKIIPIYTIEKDESVYIPPYRVNFSYNAIEEFDNSAIFQSFTNRIADHIQKYGYIKLILESSSSKVPVGRKFGKNVHLSYHRAQQAKNVIYAAMDKRGINPSKVIISDERILVQGPDYQKNQDDERLYERFQYVKILPENHLK